MASVAKTHDPDNPIAGALADTMRDLHQLGVLEFHQAKATAPEPPLWLRQFQASAHIETLAMVLAIAHWKYEGWQGLQLPLAGELRRVYLAAAETAVRFCSEVDRKVAESRAIAHAQLQIAAVIKAATADDPAAGARAITTAIKDAIDIYRYHLMRGCGRSSLEMADFLALEDDDRRGEQ